jgi:hypothetical protein
MVNSLVKMNLFAVMVLQPHNSSALEHSAGFNKTMQLWSCNHTTATPSNALQDLQTNAVMVLQPHNSDALKRPAGFNKPIPAPRIFC